MTPHVTNPGLGRLQAFPGAHTRGRSGTAPAVNASLLTQDTFPAALILTEGLAAGFWFSSFLGVLLP